MASRKAKKCKGCRKPLSLSQYASCSSTRDGLEGKCGVCRLKQRKSKNLLICKNCSGKFNSSKGDAKYCEPKCAGEARRKRSQRNCQYCSKKVEVLTYITKFQNKFYCNQSCRTEDLKKTMAGKGNPNYNRKKIKCAGCKKNIEATPSKIEKQKYIFCDNSCYIKNIGRFFKGKYNHFFKEPLSVECDGCGSVFQRASGVLNRGKRKKIKKYFVQMNVA